MSLEIDACNVPYIKIGKYKYRLETEELDDVYRRRAEVELREVPETVAKGLIELRTLLKAEPDLIYPKEDDKYLITFLRPCKFYAESAFHQMKIFYRFKQKHPKQCRGLLPAREKKSFSQNILSLGGVRNPNGARIVVLRIGMKWKPSECTLEELFRGVQLSLESALMEPKTQVGGIHVILDIKGFSLNHVMQFTPSFAKMFVDYIQDCVPIRLKSVNVVNQPYIFNMVYAIFKPLLKPKLRSRIHFHGDDMRSLLKIIPPEVLIPEYGGTLEVPELPANLFYELLNEYEEEFILADSFGYAREATKKL